jgi:hypothetical protein
MTVVATSANLNDVEETNIFVSSINKDDSKKVYIIVDDAENELLDNSQMKRHWVRFF